jgi:NAD(P)-dependent dehydrogenase (short-subunit alcohol dehydrogenase family)
VIDLTGKRIIVTGAAAGTGEMSMRMPGKHLGPPGYMVRAALMLFSDEAGGMTGQILNLAGSRYMRR